jgi:hypothetical protein
MKINGVFFIEKQWKLFFVIKYASLDAFETKVLSLING